MSVVQHLKAVFASCNTCDSDLFLPASLENATRIITSAEPIFLFGDSNRLNLLVENDGS